MKLLILFVPLFALCAFGSSRSLAPVQIPGGTGAHISPLSEVPESNTRHIIFLVHGIGGGAATFPNMREALRNHLAKLGPSNVSYAVSLYRYETVKAGKNTYDFAQGLTTHMDDVFKRIGGLRKTDKISLVVHSQGGIVSTIWVFGTLLKRPGFDHKYFKHLDSFITLGTPFWGTKQAIWGAGLLSLFSEEKRDLKGDAEIRDMEFGSNKIFDFRNSAIKVMDHKLVLALIKKQIRTLNVGGFIPVRQHSHVFDTSNPLNILSFIRENLTGLEYVESDGAVVLPSSQFDFIHAEDENEAYVDGSTIPVESFHETDFAEHTVVPALHANPLFPKMNVIKSIAQVPAECIQDLNCDHPTIKLIVKHLLHQPDAIHNDDLKHMSSFLLDVNVTLPEGSEHIEADSVKFEWDHLPSNLQIARGNEFTSSGKMRVVDPDLDSIPQLKDDVKSVDPTRYRRFFFTGVIDHSFDPRQPKNFVPAFIDFTISNPYLKTRHVRAKVRATTSTYLNVALGFTPTGKQDMESNERYKKTRRHFEY
jgi:hypothetical protein